MSIGVCPTPFEAWLSLSQGATRHGYSRSTNSPWQNAYAQRLIGSIRRACVDHIVVFGEQHLRHALLWYMNYYNEVRTHLSLGNLAPVSRVVHAIGRILPRPILGGLHHEYVRI
jgi:Integrase core domain